MICFKSPKTIIKNLDDSLKNVVNQGYLSHLDKCSKCATDVLSQSSVSSMLSTIELPALKTDLTPIIMDKIHHNINKKGKVRFSNVFNKNFWIIIGVLSIFIAGTAILVINNMKKSNVYNNVLETKEKYSSINKKNDLRSNIGVYNDYKIEDLDVSYDMKKAYQKDINNKIESGYFGDIKEYYSTDNKEIFSVSNDILDNAIRSIKYGDKNLRDVEKMLEKASIAIHKVEEKKK